MPDAFRTTVVVAVCKAGFSCYHGWVESAITSDETGAAGRAVERFSLWMFWSGAEFPDCESVIGLEVLEFCLLTGEVGRVLVVRGGFW